MYKIVIVCIIFAALWLPRPILAKADPGQDLCDDQAAHPSDPSRKAPGVDWDDIAVLDALDACEAATQAHPGVIRFQYQLGRALGRLEEYDQALALFKKTAQSGYASAQVSLGWMYANGYGVPVNYKTARKWYEKAAVQNHSVALLNLGVFYITGRGVIKDMKRGIAYLRAASRLGNSKSSYNLSLMSAAGETKLLKAEEEIPWLKKSAAQGNRVALYELAEKYILGDGMPVNLGEARQALIKSANLGFSPSAQKLCVALELMDENIIRYLWCQYAAMKNETFNTQRDKLYKKLDEVDKKLLSKMTMRSNQPPKYRTRRQILLETF